MTLPLEVQYKNAKKRLEALQKERDRLKAEQAAGWSATKKVQARKKKFRRPKNATFEAIMQRRRTRLKKGPQAVPRYRAGNVRTQDLTNILLEPEQAWQRTEGWTISHSGMLLARGYPETEKTQKSIYEDYENPILGNEINLEI